MSRATYLAIWKAKRPTGWLFKPSWKGAHADILGIRVRVDWVARVTNA